MGCGCRGGRSGGRRGGRCGSWGYHRSRGWSRSGLGLEVVVRMVVVIRGEINKHRCRAQVLNTLISTSTHLGHHADKELALRDTRGLDRIIIFQHLPLVDQLLKLHFGCRVFHRNFLLHLRHLVEWMHDGCLSLRAAITAVLLVSQLPSMLPSPL